MPRSPFRRILQACEEAGCAPPKIRYVPGDLWIEFAYSRAYLSVIPAGAPATPEVTPEVRLLTVLRGEMSRKALQSALGLKDDEHFRKAYLLPALEAALVEMTIPKRPTSRSQKYRLTAKGSAALKGAGREGDA